MAKRYALFAYASRNLTDVERRYSQTKREALASILLQRKQFLKP
jgi:hypothetical protein